MVAHSWCSTSSFVLSYENTELRWLASPTFSKNMKSCGVAQKKGGKKIKRKKGQRRDNHRTPTLGTINISSGHRDVELTIKKQAPMSTAFIFTSKSSGNWMPKLSVSVKTSFRRPLHCLLMRPMVCSPSFPFSWKTITTPAFNHKLSPRLKTCYWLHVVCFSRQSEVTGCI